MCNERRGFSLIEVLVVIVLLAVIYLGVVLFFRKHQPARYTARVANCMNNVRNLGIAATMYANDDRGGHFPNAASPDGAPAPPVQALAMLFEKEYAYDYRMYQCPLDDRVRPMNSADEAAFKAFGRGDSSRMTATQASRRVSYSIEQRGEMKWSSDVGLICDNPGQKGGTGPHRFNSTNHGTEKGEGLSQSVFFIGGNIQIQEQVSTDHEKNIFADDPDLPLSKDTIIREMTDPAIPEDTGPAAR